MIDAHGIFANIFSNKRFAIILSIAGLIYLAFCLPARFGLAILLAGLGIWLLLATDDWQKSKESLLIRSCKDGLFLGVCIFVPHFLWLLQLLLTKSSATPPGAILLYITVVLGFVVPWSLWYGITAKLIHVVRTKTNRWWSSAGIFCLSIGVYFWYLEHLSLWFAGTREGYSLLLPTLPLAQYVWFQKILIMWASFFGVLQFTNIADSQQLRRLSICYIAPSPARNAPIRHHCKHLLNALSAQTKLVAATNESYLHKPVHYHLGGDGTVLMVSPESSIPWTLNVDSECEKALFAGVPRHAYYLFGAFRQGKQGACHQSIYCVHQNICAGTYDKTHCVPFNESIPGFWQACRWAQELFLKDKTPITKGTNEGFEGCFLINNLCCIPVICSEMFFYDIVYHRLASHSHGHHVLLCWFVNDSWFNSFFKNLLIQLARLRAAEFNCAVLYVGHNHALLIQNNLDLFERYIV